MLEVNATGMQQLYPGVCSEGLHPHAHFSGYMRYTGVGSHSTSSHTRVFLGPQERASRVGGLRFLFCSIQATTEYNTPLWASERI